MRLPRDWLGPREELVPFGPRAASRVPDDRPPAPDDAAPIADELTADEATAGEAPSTADRLTAADAAPTAGEAPPPATGLPPADTLRSAGEPPPSADDFWGERSAAIHGALQAPADWAPADTAPADSAPADPDPTHHGSVGVRAIRIHGFDRRAVAVATASLAAAAVTIIAVVSIFGAGGAPQAAGGSKAGVAAVLSGGASRMFQLGLARIDASVGHEAATLVAQSSASRPRPTPRHKRAPKPIHKAPRGRSTRSSHPTSIEVARTTTAPPSTYRPAGIGTYDATSEVRTTTPTDIPPARPAPPRSASGSLPSRATVSSTGQSGALGPIHSPNG